MIADNGQGSEILSKHPFLSRQFLYDHSMHFSEQIQHQLHFPSPTKEKNYPSRAQLSFPRNFLALKIMGKAQECDLSVTGHLIVDKPFRWLISCSIFRCFEALPVCMLTLLAASPQPCRYFEQRHTCEHFPH